MKRHSRSSLKPRKSKNEKRDKSLDEFYTAEQKHREHVEKIEHDIFEHLKEHTKKVLKNKK